jgi:LCP family protein required for cell wall assembly
LAAGEGTTSTTNQSEPAPAPSEPAPGEVATVEPEAPAIAAEPAEAAGEPTEAADEPAESAEAPAPRVRGPLWARLLVAFGTVLVVLAAGTVVTALVLAHRYDSAVHHADLLAPGSRVQPGSGNGPAHLVGPLNYLLLGSDARANDPIDGQRSDTIIILHIPAGMNRAYLISIPRDLRVHIPADQDLGFQGSTEKINGAFNYGGGGVGGFQLVSRTLTQLTGVRFDGAAIIDFQGFQNVVGLLGGVDLCVDAETKSIHTGAVYHVGCQHLRPWQALDYVRQRKSLVDDDYGRERHQQQFLKAIFQEALDQGIAHNPARLDEFIRSVGGSMTVDTNGVSMVDLALAFRGITPATLTGLRVPSYGQYIGGISYVLPYEEQATGLYQAIAGDTLDAWVTANPTWVNHV